MMGFYTHGYHTTRGSEHKSHRHHRRKRTDTGSDCSEAVNASLETIKMVTHSRSKARFLAAVVSKALEVNHDRICLTHHVGDVSHAHSREILSSAFFVVSYGGSP